MPAWENTDELCCEGHPSTPVSFVSAYGKIILTDSHVRDPMGSGHVQRLKPAALGSERGDTAVSHALRSSDVEGGKAFFLREEYLQ